MSYGRNSTAAAQHLTQWDKERFNRNVLGFMKDYCATAFCECTIACGTPIANIYSKAEQQCSDAALLDVANLDKAK